MGGLYLFFLGLFFCGYNNFVLLLPIISEIVIFFFFKKQHTHIQRKKGIENNVQLTKCLLVPPDILKHNEGLRRNRGTDGF